MLKQLSRGLDRFYSDHFQNIPNVKTSFSYAVRNSYHPPDRQRCKRSFWSHESHLTVVYKILTKLGILNGRFFKDRNIGKYGKFVRNTKINQRKLTSCLGTADNNYQIVISTPRSREIFINCLITCGIGSFRR